MKPFSISTYALLLVSATLAPAAAGPLTAQASFTISALPAVSVTGDKVDIAAQKGWRVVYFWSADCPCVRDCERLSLVHLAEKYQDKVAFYAVESNVPDLAGDRQVLMANIGIHHLPYPVLLDINHVIADALKAVSTPQTFLISPDNKIVFQGAPDDSLEFKSRTGRPGITKAYLADALSQSLSGQPVQVPLVKSAGCGIVRN